MTKEKNDLVLVGETSRLNANDRIYPCGSLATAETVGHRPADILKEICILPVVETEEDFMILSPAEAKAAKAQGYKLDTILRKDLNTKIPFPDSRAKAFSVVVTEDLNIGGKVYRSYQPAGDVYIPIDTCNYDAMLDASIIAMLNRDLVTPMSDVHFGMRMMGSDIITIDFISGQPESIKKNGVLCRTAKDTVFPLFVNHIKTDTYPKYILDGRVQDVDVPATGEPFMARVMRDDDLIPLHYSIAIVSTYHGLMQIVFWGNMSLEEMKKVGVFYMYGERLFHTVFDDNEAYSNYLVIDSLAEFKSRRGITVGDPIIPITGFNIDYEAWGGAWWENKEEEDKASEYEIGKKAKEQNVDTARQAASGKNPASAIMKKLLRSKE